MKKETKKENKEENKPEGIEGLLSKMAEKSREQTEFHEMALKKITPIMEAAEKVFSKDVVRSAIDKESSEEMSIFLGLLKALILKHTLLRSDSIAIAEILKLDLAKPMI